MWNISKWNPFRVIMIYILLLADVFFSKNLLKIWKKPTEYFLFAIQIIWNLPPLLSDQDELFKRWESVILIHLKLIKWPLLFAGSQASLWDWVQRTNFAYIFSFIEEINNISISVNKTRQNLHLYKVSYKNKKFNEYEYKTIVKAKI